VDDLWALLDALTGDAEAWARGLGRGLREAPASAFSFWSKFGGA